MQITKKYDKQVIGKAGDYDILSASDPAMTLNNRMLEYVHEQVGGSTRIC